MAKMKLTPLAIILIVVVLLGVWVWTGYNRFITLEEKVSSTWAQVEVVFQRRADLIPNLVSTVKGAAEFEQSTFIEVTEARTQWMNAGSRADKVAAANGMESALSKLLLTFENYPDLSATEAYRDLMTQLEGTENRIATARRDYNNVVQTFNKAVRKFPAMILAKIFGYGPEPYLESEEGVEVAPDVNFE